MSRVTHHGERGQDALAHSKMACCENLCQGRLGDRALGENRVSLNLVPYLICLASLLTRLITLVLLPYLHGLREYHLLPCPVSLTDRPVVWK